MMCVCVCICCVCICCVCVCCMCVYVVCVYIYICCVCVFVYMLCVCIWCVCIWCVYMLCVCICCVCVYVVCVYVVCVFVYTCVCCVCVCVCVYVVCVRALYMYLLLGILGYLPRCTLGIRTVSPCSQCVLYPSQYTITCVYYLLACVCVCSVMIYTPRTVRLHCVLSLRYNSLTLSHMYFSQCVLSPHSDPLPP